MVERRQPKVSKDDPICPLCRQPIKASDRVRGRSDDLMHESCDYAQRPVPRPVRGLLLEHEPGDRALGDVEAELEELPRLIPRGIRRRGRLLDEGGDLGIDGMASSGGPVREPNPTPSAPP